MTLKSVEYIILANMNEQLRYWTFNFRKVVRQQIWGEVIDFIPSFSAVHLRMQQWKNYKIGQHLGEKWWKYEADVFLWNTL